MSTFTFDIEANNLLNQQTIDYNASPYCLTDAFKMHCVVVEEHGSGKLIAFYDGPTYVFDGRRYEETDGKNKYVLEDYAPEEYDHRPLSDFPSWVKSGAVSKIVGQNIINFDLLATKLYFGLDYTVEEDSWAELPIKIEDTMILSKVLNPDRLGGHSLDNLSSKTGVKKIAFRKNIHQDERFKFFAADMLYYCFYDCKSNTKVYEMLMKEWGDWKWDDAYRLEKAVADIITRQEHRGFKFDMDLAQQNIEFLDKALEERRQRVEPILPPKMATKTYLKGFIPPANQFVQSGKPHANIVKFCAKHGGEVVERDDSYYTTLYGKEYKLPLPVEPVCDLYVPATLNDTTHIKDWLVGLGWFPSEYKEKDLSVKTGKIKRTQQEIWKAIDGYVEQTLSTNFKNDRCDHLGVEPYKLKEKLLKFKEGRAIKVLTNPSFTKGQEKEICPNLIALVDKFPYAKDIVEYLTYKHRRNSILGGGALWDEDEDDFEKGYVASVRPDGRIPTPAATCDAATSRMKHRLVANIPRVTSLFGHEMRAMFGVDRDKFFQMGYDFDSLEAREEASYCWKYDSDKDYCNSLLQDKPNDVHCYAEDTEILTPSGWKLFGELTAEDKVAQWEEGAISFVLPQEIIWQDYSGEMVHIVNKAIDQLVTPNHRVLTVDPRSGKHTVREAREFLELSSQFAIPCSGVLEQRKEDEDFVRLLVATQADGCLSKDSTAITFSFVKDRKVLRLTALLERMNVNFSVRRFNRKGRDEINIRLFASELTIKIRKSLGEGKTLPMSLAAEGYGSLIVEESKYWDGTQKTEDSSVLDTTCRITRDTLQTCAITGGYNAYVQTYEDKLGNFGACTIHRCIVNTSTSSKTFKASRDVFSVDYSGKIGCVSVPSGLVVVRRNGKVCISGNTKMAEKISAIIQRDFGRAPAKSVKYGATYGAQGAKIAKTIGCDLKTGDQIFSAFWEAAAPLNALKLKLAAYWESTGKKFVLGLDGRKVPTRSAHAILNSLFQSAGVICAKRAMVIHDRLLKENKLSVDFFKDDWKNRKFCQQLIAYHK